MRLKTTLLSFLLLTSLYCEAKEKLVFVSLEWPPYLGYNLPDQGFGVQIIRKAFANEGYNDVEIVFLPWLRAVEKIKKKEAIGALLAYHTPEREKTFIFSNEVVISPLHFVQNKENPVQWKKLTDLAGKRIGVVEGYSNNKELDDLLSKKVLTPDYAPNDGDNLEKLGLRRVDLAVIDKNVFEFLIKRNPDLKPFQNNLKLLPQKIENRKLYLLFSKTWKGRKLVKIFNRGLAKVPTEVIKKNYLNSL
jgi:polar amino acid transport system substrate-binding protein